MKKIIALFVTALMLCLSVSTAFAMPPPFVEKVVISGEEEITMHVGETITLDAVATPVGVDSAYIAWATDKDAVVVIDAPDSTIQLTPPSSSAQITALSVGEVTLTAYTSARYNPTEYSDASDSVKITVIDRNECEKLYNIFYYTDINPVNYDHVAEKITSVDALAQVFPDDQEVLSRYDEEFFSNKFLYRIGYHAGNTSYAIRIDSVEDKENEVKIKMSITFNPDGGDLAVICPNAFLEMDKAWSDKYFDIEGSPSSAANMVKIPYYKGIDISYDDWDRDEPFPESRRTVIRSAAELTAFIEKASYLPTYDEEYNNLIATYDDEFFETKSLVFVNHKWGDGSSVYYGNLKVKNIDNKFIIDTYQRGLPSEYSAICMECDWLVIFEVSSFVFATQDVSLNINGVEILSCSPSDFKPPMTFEDLYNIAYYKRVENFPERSEGKISSYAELQQLLPDCEEILSKYDEAFFEDKFLYRIYYPAGTPAVDVKITNVTNTQNTVDIEVTTTSGGGLVAQVVVPWTIILEMDRMHYNKHISTNLGIVADPVTSQANVVRKGAYYLTDNDALIEIDLGEDNGKKCVKVGEQPLYYSVERQMYVGLVTDYNVSGTTISNVFISDGIPDKLVYGNVDGDENYEEVKDAVDSSDLVVLKRAIKRHKPLDGKWLIASDLDGDGLCNSADLLAMKMKIKNN